MRTVPLNITGPTGESRSGQNSPQRTRNFYIQATPGARSEFILLPTPGQVDFSTGSGVHRGSIDYLGQIYAVNGTSLISINSSGVATVRGTVPGSGRCIFGPIRDDNLNDIGLIIATNGNRYYYNQSTVSLMTDADLTTGNSVAVQNNVAVFDCEDDVLVHSTAGLPTTISAFFAEANTYVDEMQRVFSFGGFIYAWGTKSGEIWGYNGATTEFIFTRQENATILVGLGAIYSLTSDKDFMYLLGSDRVFYRVKSAYADPISTPEITQAIESFESIEDAEAFCYQQNGQFFYQVNFPSADRSFLYNCSNGTWTEVCSGVNGGVHNAASLVNAFGKNYVFDRDSGDCREFSSSTYLEDTNTVLRERITATIHGAPFGAPGKRLFYGALELIMEVGVGLVTGQGSDPLIMMAYSDDAGKTWTNAPDAQIGPLGGYHYKVRWFGLGSAYDRVFKFMVSDPVFVSLHSATIDIEAGI